MEVLESGLYIVSTPIGNLDDISLRAEKTLNIVDFIICENPIHSLKLLNKLGIKKKLYSLHDYNEENLIKRISKYQSNSSIALISDAGSPLISDPGYNLVLDYINKNLKITTIPGPSSIISALQLSGLPINNFKFFGFIPKNKAAIDLKIDEIEKLTTTSIFFISGNRINLFLDSLIIRNFNRNISVCKEISKKNEKVFRGFAGKILTDLMLDSKNLKGEFVIIIEGKNKKISRILDDKIEKQINKILEKFTLTETVEIVHKLTKISKKEIYKKSLMLKNE